AGAAMWVDHAQPEGAGAQHALGRMRGGIRIGCSDHDERRRMVRLPGVGWPAMKALWLRISAPAARGGGSSKPDAFVATIDSPIIDTQVPTMDIHGVGT